MGNSLEQYRLSVGSHASFLVAKLCREVHDWTKTCFYVVIFVTFYNLPAFLLLYHVSALLAFSAAGQLTVAVFVMA